MNTLIERPSEIQDPVLARRAAVFIWISLGFAFLGFSIGAAWDRSWHTTHPFEQFWSPPHLFIYSTIFVGAAAFARVLLDGSLRQQFGTGLKLPIVPFAVQPSLLFAGGGYATLWLAGMLDNVWHSNFGLDETAWSLPHATLRLGLLTVFAGLFSCHLALADRVPVRWYARILYSVLILTTLEKVATGALGSYTIPEVARKIATIPVLLVPPTQHLFRIEATWNLNHTNPLYLVLASLGVGMGLALLREIDRRDWVVAAIAVALTLFSANEQHRLAERLGLAGDPRAWLPSPLVIGAVVFLIALRCGLAPRASWFIAGAVYGVFVCLFWQIGAVWIIPGAIAMPVGAALGTLLAGVIQKPTGPAVLRFLAIANLAIPIAGGFVDLFLRWSTP